MGLIEIGRAVALLRIQGIVAGEEEPQSALFIQRVRPGVGCGELQTVRVTLTSLQLERIVVGDALGFEEHRVHVITDIRHAHRSIACVLSGGDGFQVEVVIRAYAAVRIDLAVDRILGRGYTGLVERNG